MSKFTNSYMTNAGKKLMFGGGQVTYTRAALFTQDVSAMSVDAIRKLDALDGQILSANVGIASQRPQDNGNSTIKVEATFSNAGQKQDAKFASVGWFAKTASTSETLIAVCEVEGGILGAGDPSGASTASINASVNITIGDSTTVTALVDPSGTVTKTVLDSELAKKDDTTDVDAKIANLKGTVDTKADKATVDAEIGKIDFTPYAKTADVYTKSQTDGKLGQKITFVKCDSPQAAHDASTKPAADGSIVFGIYDMNDEPSEAYVAGQKINIEWLYNHFNDFQSTVNSGLATKANKTDVYTQKAVDDAFNTRDAQINNATNLAKRAQETADTKANASDVYTKSQANDKLGQKITFVKCDSPQAAYDASTKPAADGSIVFGIYDMNDEPSEAYVAGQKINIEWLYNHLTDLQSTVNSGLATKANQSDLNSTNATVESQASEIASLKTQLNNAVNQISYIKDNYVEGRRFPASQEAQATAWENENPQRIAFITDD